MLDCISAQLWGCWESAADVSAERCLGLLPVPAPRGQQYFVTCNPSGEPGSIAPDVVRLFAGRESLWKAIPTSRG